MDQAALLYRRLFSRFATGVAVVMGEYQNGVVGMTVNSLTSVSLDPLLLLFCARNSSQSARCLITTGRFSVNILNGDQQHISRQFAGAKDVSNLADCMRRDGFSWLERSNAIFLCEIEKVYPGGDHQIILGRAVKMSGPEAVEEPLVYFDGQYAGIRRVDMTQRCA